MVAVLRTLASHGSLPGGSKDRRCGHGLPEAPHGPQTPHPSLNATGCPPRTRELLTGGHAPGPASCDQPCTSWCGMCVYGGGNLITELSPQSKELSWNRGDGLAHGLLAKGEIPKYAPLPTPTPQPTTSNQQPASTKHQAPSTKHQPTTNHQPTTTNHQPPNTNP